MIARARQLRANAAFEVNTNREVYAFDCSTISLCLSVFWWATYRQNAGAVKIHYYDTLTGKNFIFPTNNVDLSANDIALLYKNRWQIELFFKWIKQHLKVKSFWGYTANAINIQLYCAIIAYCLVAIAAKIPKIERLIYTILQIVGFSLHDKTPLCELLSETDYKNIKDMGL
jgi:hypothetical protein